MYQRILTAVDSSPPGVKQVFEAALTVAKATGAELMLLHVLSQEAEDSPVSFAPFSTSYSLEILKTYQQEWEEFKSRCQQQLETWSVEAKDVGITGPMHPNYWGSGSSYLQVCQRMGR